MSWALATTNPRAEFAVSDLLTEKQFQNHLFKFSVETIHRGRRTLKLVAAFPRYIFVEIQKDNDWPIVRECKGIWDYVRVAGTPAVVMPEVVQCLLARAGPNDVLEQSEEPSKFQFGDKVRVNNSTVIYGCEGLYQYTRNGRACVLMPWLGQLVPAEVNESDLELVSKSLKRNSGRWKKRLQTKLAA